MAVTALLTDLRQAAGSRNVLTARWQTERYRRGFRSGAGEAVAVVRPSTLLAYWRSLQACVRHDAIIIIQAQNTGLTEGSAPSGVYDRPVVIVNTLRLDGLQLINDGEQVISLPGGTLYALEKLLRPLGREPHSVIGSSCLGASIVGGVCNNSGGALLQRGPAYTELSVFAQLTSKGELILVNHLGIRLGDTPEQILTRLQMGDYQPEDIESGNGVASDREYAQRVRDVNAGTAARYNSDPRRLHEASGCAGKLAVFAVRLDTFRAPEGQQVFYIGTNDAAALTRLRQRLLAMRSLPIACEYMHRDIFDLTRKYGKDTFVMIDRFTTDIMPAVFSLKGRVDGWLDKVPFLPKQMSERVIQATMSVWPEVLPQRVLEYRDRYEHHLLLRVDVGGVDEAEQVLTGVFNDGSGAYFRCTQDEGHRAFLHRFAAAGAGARFAVVEGHRIGGLLALDIALRRNDTEWLERLPSDLEAQIETKLYYGHFLCHVFHQDYVLKRGVDPEAVKARLLDLLQQRGAEYPAEHNVGHLYHGTEVHLSHFRELDPTNSFNPGIGKDSKIRHYA